MNAAKIDLHLHLDGSLYLPWAWKTAVKRGVVEAECTFEEYYSRFHRRNFKTREEGMKRFDFPIDVMQTKEDLADAAYYLVQTLSSADVLCRDPICAAAAYKMRADAAGGGACGV